MQDKQKSFNQELIEFLSSSPTPFHAVANMANSLQKAGFTQLKEADSWASLKPGRYFSTRNESSIIAFIRAETELEVSGFKMVGAHTDSPCLKIKPQPEINKKNYYQLGVEVYGGALLAPWFDRDLSIAGRITYKNGDDRLQSTLIDFEKPVAIIPGLAIHLDREVNTNRNINSQKELPPLVMQLPGEKTPDFRNLLLEALKTQHPSLDIKQVMDYELSLYDTQRASIVGLHNDFITSARLDNLLSCFVGLKALINSSDENNAMLICSDHEEIGSVSMAGAQGPFLKSVLERLCGSAENVTRCMDRSYLISADNAHGVHPNYADKHDDNHGPLLNKGPVIKVNANQRYATNSETSAMFRHVCELADVPVQTFVVRTDMACGSTIGPIASAEVGVKTIDVGVPTFAMHSVRETAGSWDAYYLYRALKVFNETSE